MYWKVSKTMVDQLTPHVENSIFANDQGEFSMGGSCTRFNGPAGPFGVDEVFRGDSKELLHLLQSFLAMRHIMDFRRQRFTGCRVFQRHAQVDHSHIVIHETFQKQ